MSSASGTSPELVAAVSPGQKLLEYEAILANASVGILFMRDRLVQHCNPKFSELFGWPHGELVGLAGSVFYRSDEEYADIGRIATPILSAGNLLEREMSMRRRDGSTLWCHMRAKAIDPQDTAKGTIWIAEDISERKRAQVEIEELLQKQQAILDNASVGILFTRNGLIVHCNSRIEALFGWQPGSLLGCSAKVFFKDADDHANFGRSISERLGRGELVDIEWQNVRQDGTPIWSRHLAKTLPTTDGTFSTIWITEDITEKRLAQQELNKVHQELEMRVLQRTHELETARQHHAAMIQSAPLAIYGRDLNNCITSWNPAAERMFGWAADECIGKPVQTIPADKVDEADDYRRRVLEGETIVQAEVVRQRRDGSPIDISMTVAPLREGGGHIYGYLTIIADITERKASERRIQQLAYHDLLTGLPNRLLMRDRFRQAIAHAERTHTRVALLFLDLDNFKHVNDSLGHASGDALLQDVAKRLEHCIRETDTISRQGGDEFLIILRDLPDTEALPPILPKLLERLSEPFHTAGRELSTSVSMGISVFPRDGRDFESLLKKADMAMYRAKDAGRNTFRFFDESMNAEADEHLVMQNGLRRALERNEFVLHFQPKIDLLTQRVVGAEALIRWAHPTLGMVAPARFIPVAEESGLIVQIGAWVIREACREAVAWSALGHKHLSVAVNLSAIQFKRGDVEQTVRDSLADSGLEPARLELELTESILVQNVEGVLATVQRLKQLGVKMSIDDFGTGYSSLSYLKRFDIDTLKIDQSFVRDLATDADDEAIVRAIIQMAHSLSLAVIAEGVETDEILKKLIDFGCDEAQGYLFSKPLPSQAFAQFMAVRP